MSSSASSSKPVDKVPEKPKEEDSQPHLGVLEEDDEFEEFQVAGDHPVSSSMSLMHVDRGCLLDWEDRSTDIAHLKGAAPGVAKSAGDKLWEDNWDDDDIEDEFSVQLRNELAKSGKASGDPMQQ
ncbi:uncharacterized protein EDB91DRAFT_1245599 [Suillus paluster]|uniref:uncharacterized protein n=1 Tax=Suillus paluster TaxID=48578 RepID=UPI001B874AF5|nr:uncharacterized protein EDB91DRAFT_1245599 [Suillus paluster]KAG1747154.1 hypothetical protein EDB91DRAFT_1245599 [Suillus paluster]